MWAVVTTATIVLAIAGDWLAACLLVPLAFAGWSIAYSWTAQQETTP